MKLPKYLFSLIFLFILLSSASGQSDKYIWLAVSAANRFEKINSIKLPEGYKRIKYAAGSFANWLQNFPLKKSGRALHLFNGHLKANQNFHYRVLNIDVGDKDLQQCADAVIRLYAEYLFSVNQKDKISFKFTSGHSAKYSDWRNGLRPVVTGIRVNWIRKAAQDSSYASFRKYLDTAFMYAGSYSLAQELKSIANVNKIQVGDVFIQGGFPGHAVIVVDLAVNSQTGQKIFMLAQSYMPAQEIHILKNVDSESPWYKLNGDTKLYTPEWTFDWQDLKRF